MSNLPDRYPTDLQAQALRQATDMWRVAYDPLSNPQAIDRATARINGELIRQTGLPIGEVAEFTLLGRLELLTFEDVPKVERHPSKAVNLYHFLGNCLVNSQTSFGNFFFSTKHKSDNA